MANLWITVVVFSAFVQGVSAVVQKGTIDTAEAENLHNVYRKNQLPLTVKSKQVAPNTLKWSPELATIAQEWAVKLAEKDAGCKAGSKDDHSPESRLDGLGENLACFSSTAVKQEADFTAASISHSIKTAIDGWYSEYHCYQYDNPLVPRTEGAAFGHFTAMMWNSATEFGMGIARSSTGRGDHYTVANYGPKTVKVNKHTTGKDTEFKENIHKPKVAPKPADCPEPAIISHKQTMDTAIDGTYTVTFYVITEKKKTGAISVSKVSKTWASEAAYKKNDLPLNTDPEVTGGMELIPKTEEGKEGATIRTRQTFGPAEDGKYLVTTYTIMEWKNRPKEVTKVEEIWANKAAFEKGGGKPEVTKPAVKGGEELLPKLECDGTLNTSTSTTTSSTGAQTTTETKTCTHPDGTKTITVTKKDNSGKVLETKTTNLDKKGNVINT